MLMRSKIEIRLTVSYEKAPLLVSRLAAIDNTAHGEQVRFLLLLALQKTKVDYSQLENATVKKDKTTLIRFVITEKKHPELFRYFNLLESSLRSAAVYSLLMFHESGDIMLASNMTQVNREEIEIEHSESEVPGLTISKGDLDCVDLI